MPLSAHAEPAAPADVEGLLAAYARMPGLEARFVERKHLSLLAKPLESRGRIYFARPGLLLRRVEAPVASEVLITPERLQVRDGDQSQTIDLRARPDLRPFVESLVWVLAGDRRALAEVYRLDFTPAKGDGSWRLVLTPKHDPLSRLIARIQITGKGFEVSEIRVRETSGDETVTEILEADPRRRFEPAERKRLFGSGG